MNKHDLFLFAKWFSHEAREWARLLLPPVTAWFVGWHQPQPKWIKKSEPAAAGPVFREE